MAKKNYRELKEFDAADYLDDTETVAAYLALALERSPEAFQKALGTACRSKGMTAVAKSVGVSRVGLYEALTEDGRPNFVTVVKVMNALGLGFGPIVQRAAGNTRRVSAKVVRGKRARAA